MVLLVQHFSKNVRPDHCDPASAQIPFEAFEVRNYRLNPIASLHIIEISFRSVTLLYSILFYKSPQIVQRRREQEGFYNSVMGNRIKCELMVVEFIPYDHELKDYGLRRYPITANINRISVWDFNFVHFLSGHLAVFVIKKKRG